MVRINPVSIEQAVPESKAMLEQVKAKLGMAPNMFRTMAHSPAVLQAYLAFSQALSASKIPARLREQISLAISEYNRCQYCVSAHSLLGSKQGLSSDELGLNRSARSHDPKTQAALEFALALAEQSGQVNDAQFNAVRAAGFVDAEITEIVAAVAHITFTNYFNEAIHTEVDFPKVELYKA